MTTRRQEQAHDEEGEGVVVGDKLVMLVRALVSLSRQKVEMHEGAA